MNEKIVKKIIVGVFEKAKKEHASHSKFALSNHISSETDLSARTIERSYDRYINQKKKYGIPQAESIDFFCKYLGYENFRAYIESNPENEVAKEQSVDVIRKRKLMISISIVFGILLLIFGIQKWSVNSQIENSTAEGCMTWADSLYVRVSCDKGPISIYGTRVDSLYNTKLKNMKKVKVNASYKFFSNTDEPLIWYYKKSSKQIEYFTAPGLHPTNGETLRKITPYIIQTYVPKHKNKMSSFVQ